MELHEMTNLSQWMTTVPECEEFLYPFLSQIHENTTPADLAQSANLSLTALLSGLARTVKRAGQSPCDYEQMRTMLIKPNAVNIAGYVDFLWQDAFIDEMKAKANEMKAELNLNIFPKHRKAQFQNYLAVCKSIGDLPDLLIGKGFSSLMTSRFIDLFIKPGYFCPSLPKANMGEIFTRAGLADYRGDYHPFGINEMVLLLDKTAAPPVKTPSSWKDLLSPEYHNMFLQMGKNQRDHFCFAVMIYVLAEYGISGVKQYAGNVRDKRHFTEIIKNIAKTSGEAPPIHVVHQFASLFIRSDVKEKTEIISTTDGNPATCNFFLLKSTANSTATTMANHLYSPHIQKIIKKGGTNPVSSDSLISNSRAIRWIGWDKIRSFQHPYIKEYVSEIAFRHYKNNG